MKRESLTTVSFFSTYCVIRKYVILHYKRYNFLIKYFFSLGYSHYPSSSVSLRAVNLLIKGILECGEGLE